MIDLSKRRAGGITAMTALFWLAVGLSQAAQPAADASPPFTFSARGYAYSFKKGDVLEVIVVYVVPYKNARMTEELSDSTVDFPSHGDRLIARDMAGQAVQATYEMNGKQVTAWVDGYGLKPQGAEDPPHAGGLMWLMGFFIIFLFGIFASPFIVRRFFGEGFAVILTAMIGLCCTAFVIFSFNEGNWPAAVFGVLLVGASAAIGLIMYWPLINVWLRS